MAKGPKITDEVLRQIAAVYIEHPEWRAKEIQCEVNTRLRQGNPKANPSWPGLSTVQKEVTKIRGKYADTVELGQEAPWSFQSLDNYPIPPEALPSVLRAWVYTREYEALEFTVRDAKWVARFYAVYKKKDIKELVEQASAFSWGELICEVIGVPLRKDVEYLSMLQIYEHLIGTTLSFKRAEWILGEKQPFMTREKLVEQVRQEGNIIDNLEEGARHERLDSPTE